MNEVRSWIKAYWTRGPEASWLCCTSHSTIFFKKNQVFHVQPNCMTSTVTQIWSSVTRNMLILASSSWKTLVSMVNLDGYQYLQANSQRKEVLQLYMATCLYRLRAINSLLSWASPSPDCFNDFKTLFRRLLKAYSLHLQGTIPFPRCKLLRFTASPWLALQHDAVERNAPLGLWRFCACD